MRALIRVKNHNLVGRNVSFKRDVILAYYRGELDGIGVFTEDNVFLEEYYGYGLQKLIESAAETDKGYFLAERHLAPRTQNDL